MKHLILETREGVGYVTLNRPGIHNAFDDLLIAEITEAFTVLGSTDSVRAVVLGGVGTSFCAGADLGWMRRMADYDEEANRADAWELQRMFAAIAQCPKATIARVQGAAIGGGAGLVAVCDIAIATPEATFALSEVRLGLVPAVIAPYVLQKVGMGAARALFVTGERFDADTALRLGLVQQIVPASDLDTAIQRKTDLIRQAGPQAITIAKQLLTTIADKPPAEVARITVECITNLRVSAEGQEGIRAFLEKRKPGWALGR